MSERDRDRGSDRGERPRSPPADRNGGGNGPPPWDGGGGGNRSAPPAQAQSAAPPPAEPRPIIMKPLDVFATDLMRPESGPAEHMPALFAALVHATESARSIPKLGFNKESGYPYVQSADLHAIVQESLLRAKLFISPREIPEKRRVEGTILFVHCQFDVYHADGGWIRNFGSMSGSARFRSQKGVYDDKTIGKAVTSCVKSFLIHAMKIPADSDIDIEKDMPPDDSGRNGRNEDRGRDSRSGNQAPQDREGNRSNGDRDPPRDPPREQRQTGGRQLYHDEPPFDERPANDGRQAADQGAQRGSDQREADPVPVEVRDLVDKIKKASNLSDADDIWADHSNLLRSMLRQDYDLCADTFRQVWKEQPRD